MNELALAQTSNPAPGTPPLNPSRFAKSDRAALLDYARKWFSLDAAFAMCLNVALLRGMDNFMAELAAGLQQAPLAQAFYMYRSGGRIKQAMEMASGPIASFIRTRAPVPGIVLDAVMMSKAADRTLYENLLRKIVAAKPDFMMSPTTQAFLHYEIAETLGAESAEALNPVSMPEGTFEGDMRIAGLMVVRNEGPLVAASVDAMLRYCDFALVLDHMSNDGGPEEAQKQFGKDRVEILQIPGMTTFNEQAVWDCLFIRAREKKATHLTVIDADEVLGPALADPAALRAEARRLRPGEALSVPIADVFGPGFMDKSRFYGLNDLSRLLPLYRDFLYCDDGTALHRQMPLHNPRAPEGFPSRRRFVKGTASSILHFDRANPMNAMIKPDWYIAKELLQYGTPVPLALARYLPVHIVSNSFWDAPPEPDALAAAPDGAYLRLAAWQMEETKTMMPRIPPEMRFLFNFDYWG